MTDHFARPDEIDLGHGHFLHWAGWHPDRKLNPHYDRLPDVPHCTALIRHELLPGDDNEMCRAQGYCEGAATMDGPVTAELFPEQARWQVLAEDPLTLSPSILCHCGDHGFINNGRWVPA